MQFSIERNAIYKPLQRLAGALEKKQTLPILSNILVVVKHQLLSLTATDCEIEMVARIPLSLPADPITTTIPGKKIIDICKALPETATLQFEFQENKLTLRANRSRFTLACLPADQFPRLQEGPGDVELSLPQNILRQLLAETSFAMAQQDVRYYLNGVCMLFEGPSVRMVATDGHRLSTLSLPLKLPVESPLSIILPRKAIFELQHLFSEGEGEIGLVIGKNHLRAVTPHFSFVTKLIEGKFPDYHRVLPAKGQGQTITVPREGLRQALLRVSALFSDKYRGVNVALNPKLLRVSATTQEKDEVEDELEIAYEGPPLEIGLNASYMIEYLNIMTTTHVRITFISPQHAVLFELSPEERPQGHHAYVVMPMRL